MEVGAKTASRSKLSKAITPEPEVTERWNFGFNVFLLNTISVQNLKKIHDIDFHDCQNLAEFINIHPSAGQYWKTPFWLTHPLSIL